MARQSIRGNGANTGNVGEMTSHDDFRTSTGFAAIRLAVLASAVAVVAIGVLIGVVADSLTGRLFGVGSILVGLVPVGAVQAYAKRSLRWRRLTVLGFAVAVGCAVWTIAKAPSGVPDGRLKSFYPEADTEYPRMALSNLLPEEDQLLAGFTIAPLIDPILTTSQSARLKEVARQVYRELEADRDFHALGSAMRFTYGDLIGQRPGPRHCYTYVPPNIDRTKPAPLLVFFHGSGGNFKGYLWVLSRVADDVGLIVAAPSDGIGTWPAAECDAQLDFAIEAAGKVGIIDPQRIHIMGLSNGGLAVSRLARSQGQRFASLIFVSPVFDPAAIRSPELSAHAGAKPALVISGAADDRVPLAYVREQADLLTTRGLHVEQHYVDTADHFLIFTHRADVAHRLVDWCRNHN